MSNGSIRAQRPSAKSRVLPTRDLLPESAGPITIAAEECGPYRDTTGTIDAASLSAPAFGNAYRHHVARELHDRVGQEIAVAARRLELFSHHRDGDRRRADEQLAFVQRALCRSLDDIRRLSRALRIPYRVHDLEQALRDYARTMGTADTTLHIAVVGDTGRLPKALQENLFLMVREALSNALVHARSDTITATISIGADEVRAAVEDDGVGFDPLMDPGVGLASIRERSALLGGRVLLSGRVGRGTLVEITVPLSTAAPNAQTR